MSKDKLLDGEKALPVKVDKYERLSRLSMPYEPFQVKKAALKEIEGKKEGDQLNNTGGGSPVIRAMTLKEFDNGLLMSIGLNEVYQTFAIQLSLDYQAQYKCNTPARKSLAEVTALNYCRILDIQRRITNYLERHTFTDLGIKYVTTLSKELDRAERHYLTSIQALEIGLQPPLSMTVRTQVANVAQQQIIQEKLAEERKRYDI
jgi:hypothetical protein